MISILQVWEALDGPPVRHNRAPAFYRQGRNPGSVRFYPDTNSFYDFGACVGGHTVTLVATALGIPYENARQWLQQRFGGRAVQPYQPIDQEELSRANGWKLAMIAWLEQQLVDLKRQAAEDFAAGTEDPKVAIDIHRATEYMADLRALERHALIRHYHRALALNPEQTRELLEWAAETESIA